MDVSYWMGIFKENILKSNYYYYIDILQLPKLAKALGVSILFEDIEVFKSYEFCAHTNGEK